MKKILLTVLLAVASVLPSLAIYGFDYTYEGQTLQYVYYSGNDDFCYVNQPKYSDISGEVIVPATAIHGGKEFKVIGTNDYCFCNCSELNSIIFLSSDTELGKYTFKNCSNLVSVKLPENCGFLTGCFEGCSKLESIEIPKSVTKIGDGAFSGCKSLKSIVIPESVTKIGCEVFSDCESLTSLVIPDSVTIIWYAAFSGCKSLTSLKLPKGLNYLHSETFYDCTSLKSLVIPESVTNIGDRAFSGCESLTSLVIPESVTFIGNYVFTGCSLELIFLSSEIRTYTDNDDIILLGSLDKNSHIICQPGIYNKIIDNVNCRVSVYPFQVNIEPLLFGAKLKVTQSADLFKQPLYDILKKSTVGDFASANYTFEVKDTSDEIVNSLEIQPDEEYVIKNLKTNNRYAFTESWRGPSSDGSFQDYFSTKNIEYDITYSSKTQTSLKGVSPICPSDETATPTNIYLEGVQYSGKPVDFTDLMPDTNYNLKISADYNGNTYQGTANTVTTDGWGFTCSKPNVGPTSVFEVTPKSWTG